jgi:hypothetical protein
MSDHPQDPYISPNQISQAGEGSAAGRMQYMQAYQYVMDSGNWFLNLLLIFVCQLIPIVGPIVVMGYQFEIIEALHRNRGGTYPDFSFDLFVEYLKRGLWPFLVSLIIGAVVGIPLMIVFYILMFVVIFGAAAAGDTAGPVVVLVGMPLMMILMMGMIIVLSLFMLPMLLRAGLAQEFGEAFNFEFVKSFVGKVWVEMLLSALFMAVTGCLFAMVGMAVFCIGVYLAAAWIGLAQAHIYYQLYEIFLARGGKSIPLKPQTAPAKA